MFSFSISLSLSPSHLYQHARTQQTVFLGRHHEVVCLVLVVHYVLLLYLSLSLPLSPLSTRPYTADCVSWPSSRSSVSRPCSTLCSPSLSLSLSPPLTSINTPVHSRLCFLAVITK